MKIILFLLTSTSIFYSFKAVLSEKERMIIMGQETSIEKNIIALLIALSVSISLNSQENLSSEGNLSTVYSPLYREMGYDMNNLDTNYTESPVYNPLRKRGIMEWDIPADSNHIDTFTDAFNDPNIVIGVFDNAALLALYGKLTPEEESIMSQPGIMDTAVMNLVPLHLVKPIKGKFNKSIIFISSIFPPYREGLSQIPHIKFSPGAKWVFALRKTTKEFRIERWGEKIEKYDYLNDDTVFIQFRFGYGALCLKWPKPDDEGIPPSRPNTTLFVEPEGLVKVPESMIEDLEVIEKVIPLLQKENKDPNDTAAIEKTSQALKNNLAKYIFSKLSKKKTQ
ncbi:MAG: hypothetical protein JW787_06150 [Sedimentisphaerales bacterium]|nr:hypothetical protein [Sedimentisphaerales bacterium]